MSNGVFYLFKSIPSWQKNANFKFYNDNLKEVCLRIQKKKVNWFQKLTFSKNFVNLISARATDFWLITQE